MTIEEFEEKRRAWMSPLAVNAADTVMVHEYGSGVVCVFRYFDGQWSICYWLLDGDKIINPDCRHASKEECVAEFMSVVAGTQYHEAR